MKHTSGIVIVSILMLLMCCQKTVNVTAEKAAITKILYSYITSIENEDIDLYGKIIVHSPDMVNFGSGASDRIVGWDDLKQAIEAQNTALTDTKITQSDVTITLSFDGRFAWATSLWNFKATMQGQVIELPVRCSWILEKDNNEWKIVHFHKSVGMAS